MKAQTQEQATTQEQQAQHVLSYRFPEDKEYRSKQGTFTELRDFVNDFNWLDLRALLDCSYIKHNALGEVRPSDSLIEHFINPLPVSSPTKEAKETKQIRQAKQTKQITTIRSKSNREHEACFIRLHEQVTVTCVETGISFSCQLPLPEKLNLEVLHPLSFFSNVQSVIRSYSNKGIFLESELSNQVLSGMLLTILRHKKLLVCHDYVKANLCLQRVKLETLSKALRFFSSLPSTLDMPQLHLVPEAMYDFHSVPISLSKEQIIADRTELMILNFIKVCKGEVEGENRIAGTILKTRKEKAGAKVRLYGGNADIEHRQALSREKLAQKLLEKLMHLHPVPFVSQAFYSLLEARIEAFIYLGTEKRTETANQILERFNGSEHIKIAKELAALFATTKTETLENSLFTFSQELEQDLGQWKGQKRKFNLFAKEVIKEKENE